MRPSDFLLDTSFWKMLLKQEETVHLLGTIFSCGLKDIWCCGEYLKRNLSPSGTAWHWCVFNSFWTTMEAQRNKIHQALATHTHTHTTLGSIHCWFWSFHDVLTIRKTEDHQPFMATLAAVSFLYQWSIFIWKTFFVHTDWFKSDGGEESIDHKVDFLRQVSHTEVLQQSFLTAQTVDQHTESQPTQTKHTDTFGLVQNFTYYKKKKRSME